MSLNDMASKRINVILTREEEILINKKKVQ